MIAQNPNVLIRFIGKSGDARLATYKLIIEECPLDINYANHDERTALQECLSRGLDDLFGYLITRPDIDLNKTNGQHFRSPLQMALCSGQFSKCEDLIARFASVTNCDPTEIPCNYNGFMRTFADSRTHLRWTLGVKIDANKRGARGDCPI